jgi:hypothetical protein
MIDDLTEAKLSVDLSGRNSGANFNLRGESVISHIPLNA